MWKLYTPDMHGVRIRLPCFPFKIHHYRAGEYGCEVDTDTALNMEFLFNDNRVTVDPPTPCLNQVQYVDDDSLIYPNARESNDPEIIDIILSSDSRDEVAKRLMENGKNQMKVEYRLDKLGVYKKASWDFQKEWRYRLITTPMGLKSSLKHSFDSFQEWVRRIEDLDVTSIPERLYLELDENDLNSMEIIAGPRMSAAEFIQLEALVEKYCPKAIVKKGALAIR